MLGNWVPSHDSLPLSREMLTALHVPAACLEGYSLANLCEPLMDLVHNHVLLCEECRQALGRIEPVGFVHLTLGGLVYSKITRLSSGRWFARHWGEALADGRDFGTLIGARRYLDESFSERYPDHVCGMQCGSTVRPTSWVWSFFR